MLLVKNVPLKYISYEGVFFGYLIFYFCKKQKQFFSNKYITLWFSIFCLVSFVQSFYLLIFIFASYIEWFQNDLLVVFLTISQDSFIHLKTVGFHFAILFYRKRALKWLNFGLQLSEDLTRNDLTLINKSVGIQIFYRFIQIIALCVLHHINYPDLITWYHIILFMISFNTNLVEVELYRTCYIYLITLLKRVSKDITFQRDFDKLALSLINIEKSMEYVNKYLSKPILIVFGLIFLGVICNVSIA